MRMRDRKFMEAALEECEPPRPDFRGARRQMKLFEISAEIAGRHAF
jgi:hypothetical protein